MAIRGTEKMDVRGISNGEKKIHNGLWKGKKNSYFTLFFDG
jgi:hypothetical protein